VARNRRKLPVGWSHPIKASEVAEVFPGVGHITWNGRPANWRDSQDQAAFWLSWSPRSALPQPVLTIWAVPSKHRAAIHRWTEKTVAPQAHDWLRSLGERSPVWRDTEHMQAWRWTPS
jgi:hypothetical protein